MVGNYFSAQDTAKVSQAVRSVAKLRKAVDKNDDKGVADTYVTMATDYYNQEIMQRVKNIWLKPKLCIKSLTTKKALKQLPGN